MEQQLSDKDKRTLDIFSMYLQAHGSKVGKFNIMISTDGEVYWDYSYWIGDSTRMTIDTYDAIDELINRIFKENEDTILDNFTSDDRGNVVAIVNCNDRTLIFKAEVTVMDVEYSSQEYTFDDITNKEIKNWLNDIAVDFVFGDIHYEGGGDDGYIESDIVFNDDTRDDYPKELKNWMYDQLGQYGGWENNDGGQGDFHFNFDRKIIQLNHGENYERDEIYEIPLKFTF
jgi:hypothetical protein